MPNEHYRSVAESPTRLFIYLAPINVFLSSSVCNLRIFFLVNSLRNSVAYQNYCDIFFFFCIDFFVKFFSVSELLKEKINIDFACLC